MSRTAFREQLENLLNKESQENGSNTPDFILTMFLTSCLNGFDSAVVQRDNWYHGKVCSPGPGDVLQPPAPPQRDDEACGIGGKEAPPSHAQMKLSQMLRGLQEYSVPFISRPYLFDEAIKHAEGLEEKAKAQIAAKKDDEACGHGWLSNTLKEVRPGGRSFIGEWDSLIRRAEDLEEKAKSSERRESEIRQLRGAIANTCQQLKTLTRQRDALVALCEEMILSYVHATDDSGVVSRVKGMKLLAWKSMYNAFTGKKAPKESDPTTNDCTITGLTDPIQMLERVKPIMKFHDVLGWENLINNVAGLANLCKSVIAKFRPIGFDGIHQATVQGHVCYEWETKFFQVTGRKVHPGTRSA